MISLLSAGALNLPPAAGVLWALASTHLTIIAVTVYLHRHQSHHALTLHPAVGHCFRFWLWLTTGMVTKEWVAIHRKHHAKVDRPGDPHSPVQFGLARVLWGGVLLYVRESNNPATIERYGHGTPDDWIERRLYARSSLAGLALLGLIDVVGFGLWTGGLVFLVQIAWIPFWAAGVINGIGHCWGYRSWRTADASRNIVPWGILIGGEELHNNHHAFPTSARLSVKWYEIDLGWIYIRLLALLGLARVKHLVPRPRLDALRSAVDMTTLRAVVANRYMVMADFDASLRRLCADERKALKWSTCLGEPSLNKLDRWILADDAALTDAQRAQLSSVLAVSRPLGIARAMRAELHRLWERSNATNEVLLDRLRHLCRHAESCGVSQLTQFSRRLRTYS